MSTNIGLDGLSAPYSPPTLFPAYTRCHACSDIGFVVEKGEVRECWRARTGVPHNSPRPAAVVLRKSVMRMLQTGLIPEAHLFRVAQYLTEGTTAVPSQTRVLLDRFFAHTRDPLRDFAKAVETLRSVWLLPVGSRRGKPAGYWIITELDDFAEWVSRAKQAPITQLTTIHRVARANFPLFAEQLELEFWNDMAPAAAEEVS